MSSGYIKLAISSVIILLILKLYYRKDNDEYDNSRPLYDEINYESDIFRYY